MRTHPRGSALLIAILVVLVLTVIGVGMVRFAGREVAGSLALSRQRAVTECAEAARLQLVSQFHALGFQPSLVQPMSIQLGTTGNATTWALGGHYDTPGAQVTIEQVSLLPLTSGGPVTQQRDQTNNTTLGGGIMQPFKVMALCKDGTINGGRQLEIEFGIKFGM